MGTADFYRDKRILIFGASGGLGQELARQLALRGAARLYLSGRREAALRTLAEELRAKGTEEEILPCDVTHPEALAACIERAAAAGLDGAFIACGVAPGKKRRRSGGAGGHRPVSGGEYGGAGGGHGPALPVLGTDGRRPFPFRGDLAGGAPAASVRSGVRRIKGRAECLRRGAPGPAPRVRHGAHAGHAGLLRQSHGAALPRAEVVRPLCGGGGGKNAGRHRPGPGAVHFPAGAPRNHSPGAGASAAARPVGHGAFCLRDAAGRAPET